MVNPDPANLSVADGALRIAGQPGDTYQTINTAKNIVVLDVPEGDFTATTDVSAAVAKVYQGAGLIAWQDMDNYVRSGLTFVGGLSPSGIAVETDVESGATFSAVSFADRPASSAERLRLARVGDTITTSYWDEDARGSPPARPTSPSTPPRSASTPWPPRTAPSSRRPSTPSPSSTSPARTVAPTGPFVARRPTATRPTSWPTATH